MQFSAWFRWLRWLAAPGLACACLCAMVVTGAHALESAPTKASAGSSKPAPLIVYGYHLKPPFIIDENSGTGLYFDFSRYINRKLAVELLRTQYLPRKRLDQLVQSPEFRDLVIGVNPLWFGDANRQKFWWTSPILHDRDEVLSSLERPIHYQDPSSLSGLTVGLPRGYYYFGIDEMAQRGLLRREDGDNERQNIHKLEYGRIQATIVSRSTLNYFMKVERWQPKAFVAARPHDEFDRMVLVARQREDIYRRIEPIIAAMPADPQWQLILARYQ